MCYSVHYQKLFYRKKYRTIYDTIRITVIHCTVIYGNNFYLFRSNPCAAPPQPKENVRKICGKLTKLNKGQSINSKNRKNYTWTTM